MTIKPNAGWTRMRALMRRAPALVSKAAKMAVKAEAHHVAGEMKKKLRTGPFTPLSPLTLASRKLRGFKGRKPLLDRGDLRDSIAVLPDGLHGEYFIGVPIAAKDRKGNRLVRLALVHEEGRTIVMKLTKKMRAYLFGVLMPAAYGKRWRKKAPAAGANAGTGIVVVRIPARPFIRPVFEDYSAQAAQRFESTFLGMLEDIFGKAAAPRPPRPKKDQGGA